MAKFLKVDTRYQGETFPEIINLDNIGRIAIGPEMVFLSGMSDSSVSRVSLTSESMHKLLEHLDMEEE